MGIVGRLLGRRPSGRRRGGVAVAHGGEVPRGLVEMMMAAREGGPGFVTGAGDEGAEGGERPAFRVDDQPFAEGSAALAHVEADSDAWYVVNGRRLGRAEAIAFLRDPANAGSYPDEAVVAEASLRRKVAAHVPAETPDASWDDVVGQDEAKRAMVEAALWPVRHGELADAYRQRPSGGLLLFGPSGCGKTSLVRALCAELAREPGATPREGSPAMLHVRATALRTSMFGAGEAMVRDVFAYARAWAALNGRPLPVFVDEADAVLPSRDGAFGRPGANGVEVSLVSAFLSEMQGFDGGGAYVILATNRPGAIDAAVLRDGRVDDRVEVGRPTEGDARAMVGRRLAGVPLGPGEDPAAMAEALAGAVFSPWARVARLRTARGVTFLRLSDVASGALVEGAVERAKRAAIRRDAEAGAASPSGVTTADLLGAVERALAESRLVAHPEAVAERAARDGEAVLGVERLRDGAVTG